MRYIIHALTGWLGKDDLEVITTNPKIVRSMKNLLREYGYAKDYVGHFPELGVTILKNKAREVNHVTCKQHIDRRP